MELNEYIFTCETLVSHFILLIQLYLFTLLPYYFLLLYFASLRSLRENNIKVHYGHLSNKIAKKRDLRKLQSSSKYSTFGLPYLHSTTTPHMHLRQNHSY